jgi:hypothetical protein
MSELQTAVRDRKGVTVIGHYCQIFELDRLDDAVGIQDDQEAALAPAGLP